MMSLRRAVTLLIIVLLLPLAADDPALANTHDLQSIQEVLDARLDALASGDKDTFLATIDPRASDSFRSQQALSYDGWRSVPLVDHRLSIRLDDSGNLAEGLNLARRYDADAAFLPETRRSYRLGEYDDRPAIDQLWWTYVERSGRWYVASDSDVEDLGLDSNRQLWDFGPVEQLHTEHFLVISGSGQATRREALASIAEEAMREHQKRWSEPWSKRIPIIVPSSPEQAAVLLRTSVDVDRFVAFVTYTPMREEGWSTTAPRIYAQEQNLSVEPRSRQVADMLHELTHAAAAHLSGPFVPTWLHEGLAERVRLGSAVPPVAASGGRSLPTAADFVSSDPNQLGGAYSVAALAISLLARTEGPEAPIEVFKAIGSRRVEPGSPAYNVDQSFIAVTGDAVSSLEAKLLTP